MLCRRARELGRTGALCPHMCGFCDDRSRRRGCRLPCCACILSAGNIEGERRNKLVQKSALLEQEDFTVSSSRVSSMQATTRTPACLSLCRRACATASVCARAQAKASSSGRELTVAAWLALQPLDRARVRPWGQPQQVSVCTTNTRGPLACGSALCQWESRAAAPTVARPHCGKPQSESTHTSWSALHSASVTPAPPVSNLAWRSCSGDGQAIPRSPSRRHT
jgi:hypothetical protein